MEPTIATIRQCLGTLIFGEEDDELEHAVLRLLDTRGQTLSTVEWGLDGLLAHWLATADNNSENYLGSWTLGVTAEPGPTVAEQLATTGREKFKADFTLSACLGPVPNAGDDQPRQVFFGLAGPDGVTSTSTPYIGHSSILKPRAAKYALNFLRLTLLG
jgi:nicotinamide-nucleotide amidase